MSETVGFQQQARVHCQIPTFQILNLIRFQHQIEWLIYNFKGCLVLLHNGDLIETSNEASQ